MKHHVVTELSPEVVVAFKDFQVVSLDVEGVDLSRAGTSFHCFCRFGCF
jgi:hypothetical protein